MQAILCLGLPGHRVVTDLCTDCRICFEQCPAIRQIHNFADPLLAGGDICATGE